jgi:hypothetical protein
MTETEYDDFFDRLLKSMGSSLASPSGWGGGGTVLYFSCAHPPIEVPLASSVNEAQRTVIVARASRRFSFS